MERRGDEACVLRRRHSPGVLSLAAGGSAAGAAAAAATGGGVKLAAREGPAKPPAEEVDAIDACRRRYQRQRLP